MSDKYILDGSKVLYHKDRIEAYLRGERIAPITIDCALTTMCTYRCVYCYGKMQLINQFPSIERETVMSFLDDAAAIGVKAVSFVSDGESTCNPCYADAIVHGKENGLDMALGTNGFLLTREDLVQILPCLTYLRFNISAADKNRYMEIHGVNENVYERTINNIKDAVEIKKKRNLSVTIGLQMVLMPAFRDQIIPLAKLGKSLGVDYLVIKHCSDDENHSLGVDYSDYDSLSDILHEAESFSTDSYQVSVKWSKIQSNGIKCYKLCYGAPFIIQLSGSGLVAPCGMLFNDKYSDYHIGNIKEKRFKEIWESDRYWDVMRKISSPPFDTNTNCGTLCLQHKTNEVIWKIVTENKGRIPVIDDHNMPNHINFI